MARRVLACLAALGSIGAAGAAHAQTVPVTILNKTGISGKLYVTVLGLQPGTATHLYSDAAGNTKPFATENPTPSDYGFNTTGNSITFQVPQLQSARIYVSFCQPSYITVTRSNNGAGSLAPNTPAPWVPTDANYKTVIDYAEFDYRPGGNGLPHFDTDLTQVDTLGIPMQLNLKSASQNLTSGFNNAASGPAILAALATASPYNKLVVRDSKKRALRVLIPEKAMALAPSDPNYFPNTTLNNYIDQVFTNFAKPGKSFTLNDGTTVYTGTVVNNQLQLKPNNGGDATVFGKPSTQYVWQNGAPFASGNQGPAGNLQRYIQAAFLRSIFLTNSDISACPVKNAYTQPPINAYSSLMHANSIHGGAYGFAYDDVCENSSNIALDNPTQLTITLMPLDVTWSKMTCSN